MTRHLSALVLAAAMTVTACSAADQAIDEVQSVVDNAVEEATSALDSIATEEGAPDDQGGTSEAPAPDEPDAPAPTESAPEEGGAPAPVAVNDGGGVGANGLALLRGDRARLVIEVDVQAGARVSQGALDHVAAVIAQHADKSEIVFEGGNEFASDDESWTIDDLNGAVAANRSTASDDGQVSVHLLVVRGVNERDGQESNAIGLAYSASTIAFFPERLDGLAGLTGGDGVARAVLVHEVGHLFGLVNLTYASDIDHEDPENPGHSSSQDSVMFHAVESTLVAELFGGGPPDRFDADDASDLEGLKTGRLQG